MRGVTLVVLAAAVGAVVYMALLRGPADAPAPAAPPGGPAASAPASPGGPAPTSVGAQEGAGPALQPPAEATRGPMATKRPRFYTGDPSLDVGSRAPVEPGDPGARIAETAPPAATPPAATPPAADVTPAVAQGLEAQRQLAQAAFGSGDKEKAVRLMRQITSVGLDRADVDLSPEVRVLLDVETDREKKLEYLRYLTKRDGTGRVFETQLDRCVKRLASVEMSPEEPLAAWDDLTLAYELAADRSQKRKVIDLLQPFMKQMVFSGGHSPLLKSYTVQGGDSLSGVAAQLQTTVDALKRINNLKGDMIQPRQKLRYLPGKLKIFVKKSDFDLWATVDGRIFLDFTVGLGKDNPTPLGKFSIAVRQKDPTWWRAGQPSVPPGHPDNVLGTRWLGFRETKDFAGYGIHGTTDPSSIGAKSSGGCVRMRKDDIELLYDFVRIDTEVEILP